MEIEKVYVFTQSDGKLIEQIIDDDVAMINHLILNQGEALPTHDSNSNVYMIIVRGTITLQLANEEKKRYDHGCIVNIPGKVTMNIMNADSEQVEFFIVKAPSPRLYE